MNFDKIFKDNEYQEVIDHVSSLMNDNEADWVTRYKRYLEVLAPGGKEYSRIERLKNLYHIEEPMTRYLSISYVEKASSSPTFDIRVYGHSLGNLKIKLSPNMASILDLDEEMFNNKRNEFKKLTREKGVSVFVIEQSTNKKNVNAFRLVLDLLPKNCNEYKDLNRWIEDKLGSLARGENTRIAYDWNSVEMEELRRILQLAKTKFVPQSEHSYENLLLRRLAESSSDKYIRNIQPVQIGNSGFFQMPTCLKGSSAKKEYTQIGYAAQNGGGIDILAHIRRGNKAELCVIELKDNYENGERLVKAMKQAIAYATCLDYIIRSSEVNENASWYNDIFMSTSKVELGESININVVVAMPYMSGADSKDNLSEEDKCIAGETIEITVYGHVDRLILHYMFFKPEALKDHGIENGIITSLFDK